MRRIWPLVPAGLLLLAAVLGVIAVMHNASPSVTELQQQPLQTEQAAIQAARSLAKARSALHTSSLSGKTTNSTQTSVSSSNSTAPSAPSAAKKPAATGAPAKKPAATGAPAVQKPAATGAPAKKKEPAAKKHAEIGIPRPPSVSRGVGVKSPKNSKTHAEVAHSRSPSVSRSVGVKSPKKAVWPLKLKLKKLMYRQRSEENQALGVRKAALQEWAEYKLNLDDAQKAARESARYSKAILKYARKAVAAKKKEQKWAKSAFADLQKAMKEEADHPERIKPEREMTMHEKLKASSDDATNLELDPFHDRSGPISPLKKAEDQLEQRVFSGDASKSEIRAYHELHRMHHYTDKKRRNTYMGEVLEIVRKKDYGSRFDNLMKEAGRHAEIARKYTAVSSRIVKRAKAISRLEEKLLKKIQEVEKAPTVPMQKVQRVVVQLVDPPKHK